MRCTPVGATSPGAKMSCRVQDAIGPGLLYCNHIGTIFIPKLSFADPSHIL